MKQKILFIITKSNWGGAQRYVFDLATHLPKDKFEVIVAFGQDGELSKRLAESGIRTISIPRLARDVNPLPDAMVIFDLIKIFRREQPDVIHLNSAKIGGLGALAGKLCNLLQAPSSKPQARIMYTVHGWTFNEKRPMWQKAVIKFLQWLNVVLCHSVIVIAQREYEQMAELPFTKKKLVLIHNGLTEITFKSREESRKELGTRISCDISQGFVIGTISELHKNKGLDFIIEAMGQIKKTRPEAIFVIISGGELRTVLEAQIKKRDLENSVFLLGAIPNAREYLKAFDIFTLTSRKEGLPYVILEAGAAGLPVIASKVGGIPEIMEDGKSGLLVNPKNTGELEHALIFLKPASFIKFIKSPYPVLARKFL